MTRARHASAQALRALGVARGNKRSIASHNIVACMVIDAWVRTNAWLKIRA